MISRFYGAAASVVDEWNGLVDKFVGDEGAGELLVSRAAAASAGLDDGGLEARTLELRGLDETVDAVVAAT